MWQQILIQLVLIGISYALTPKPRVHRQPAEDVEIPVAEEGKPIPVLFGTAVIKGMNCVWYGDVEAKPIKKSGGKK